MRYAYLQHIDQRQKLKLLTNSKLQAETDLKSTYQEYVRNLTWLSLKSSLSNKRRSALQAYLSALKNLGKGKGKSVRGDRFREDARRAMQDAYAAVPCWIMPHWRVSEALPPEIGLFDLVIVDEASQSDIWALPALLRGKKILIVGDDEQISPTTFAKEKDILRLRDQYLSNLPYNFQAQVLPGKSIYDLARVVFPQSHITLIEHFRCVSPIIEFSNQLCYNGKIQCLRLPKASERIDPPLVDVFVKGGYREGKRNPPEAKAIVMEIEKLVKDPQHQKRSIGVVSLIGNEQAHLINELVLKKFGEDIVRQFNILCGDSMTFQGNERDIMFLSMVATPDDAIAQTKREYRQRFNVACSRARDRMYLYRSVRREDLSNEDLRARLIEHFDAPLGNKNAVSEGLREQCQSSFELAVFDALVERGFHVVPQVESSGFYIDMVVEGDSDRRLAIECDGDLYHGPEKWAEDFGRQRVLERAGWNFWRCWGSSFYMNSKECLNDLFSTLESMGIGPTAKAGYVQPGLVERREIDPNIVEESEVIPISANIDETKPSEVTESTMAQGVASELPIQIASNENHQDMRRDDQIDIGEVVEYYFTDAPNDIHRFKLIELGPSDFGNGLINVNDQLGAVLIGLSEGDEVGITVNKETRLITIAKIHDISHPDNSDASFGVHSNSRSNEVKDSQSAVDKVATPNFFSKSKDEIRLHMNSPKLSAYQDWPKRSLTDPRTAKPQDILDGLVEIVRAEGPIVSERVHSLYCEAAGLGRMGTEIRASIDKAIARGVAKGTLLSRNEFRTRNRLRNILRIPGTMDAVPRDAGGRSIEDIPPTEIAAAMHLVYRDAPALSVDELYRRTLKMFGLQRLSESVRSLLSLCYRDYFEGLLSGEVVSSEGALSPTHSSENEVRPEL